MIKQTIRPSQGEASTEEVYGALLRASKGLEESIARALEHQENPTCRELSELSRALKTAVEIRRELNERTGSATRITVRFEQPDWAG